MTTKNSGPGNDWTKKIEVTGEKLVETVKKIYAEGKTQRIIIRAEDGRELLTVPMNTGLLAGGVMALAAPVLAAVAGVAALVAKVHLEVVPVDSQPPKGERL